MAQPNQMLFNLNVPYNPMNMVTQFHNPGPVIIERLAGAKQTEAPKENSEKPVQFSVISKEKLSFAMQLARRDMKNKIREQQQQHYRQQIEEKLGSAKPQKKVGKKKGIGQKANKLRAKPSSPENKKPNINHHTRSVRTQTPPPKGSPLLLLQSHSQRYDDYERKEKRTEISDEVQTPTKPSSDLKKNTDYLQKKEIARLNRELKTCVERINTLSKQVSEPSTTVASPDRTSTLRAGLEALMRADPNQVQRSEIMKANPRPPQRKPVEKRTIHSSSVILPSKTRSRHHHKDRHMPREGSMHFTQPTESSKSKAIAAEEVLRRVLSGRTSPRAETKPWTPPGSPQSFHKVQLSKQHTAQSNVKTDAEYEEIDSTAGSPGRAKTDQGIEGRQSARHKEDRVNGDGSIETSSSTYIKPQSDKPRPNIESRAITSLSTKSHSHGSHVHDTRDGDQNLLDERSMKREGRKRTPGRRVLFDQPAGSTSLSTRRADQSSIATIASSPRSQEYDHPIRSSHSSLSSGNHGHHVHTNATSSEELDHGRDAPAQYQREDETHPYVTLSRGFNREDDIGSSDHSQGGKHQLSSHSTLRNIKERITDLLVDEIVDDAVQEWKRMDEVAMVTKEAQRMEDTPTLENLLQELECMEVEEERIRRRWKNVRYDDPGGSLGGQRSKVNEVWLKGTPLDAQQMERVSDMPSQHTAISFTNSNTQERRGNVYIHQTDKNHPAHEDDVQDFRMIADRHLEPTQETSTLQQRKGVAFPGYTLRGHHSEATQPPRPGPNVNDVISPHHTRRDHPSKAIGNSMRDGVYQSSHLSSSGPTWKGVTSQDYTTGEHHADAFGSRGRDGIPVFIPSDMFKRVQESRDDFEAHLKRTSHLPYGTFDPWKLVEKISDELVDEIIFGITEEVSDVVGNYVEAMYETEFDVKTEDASSKEKARKALFT